ncbi:fasciclin domain-containing protein [Scytonema sp. NUACC21]
MPNLVETASQAGNFSKLVKAVEAAGLVDTLNSPGPFTVFAPTDEAFAKLPQGTLDELLKDTHKLKRILAYHVASGDVRSDDLIQIDHAETLEGSVVGINATQGKVKVNDANVLQTDILTDNGVIHAIDAVLIPTFVTSEA